MWKPGIGKLHARAFHTWNALQGFEDKSLPPNDSREALPPIKQSFEALTALKDSTKLFMPEMPCDTFNKILTAKNGRRRILPAVKRLFQMLIVPGINWSGCAGGKARTGNPPAMESEKTSLHNHLLPNGRRHAERARQVRRIFLQ